MLLDAERREDGWFSDTVFDVCICGAGPAGITLARTLAAKGKRVALMEAGGLASSVDSQAIYEGSTLGLSYPLEFSRLRYFGGTSNHWDGQTRPLDPRDFEPLPHYPMNQWPIKKPDLDVYAGAAAEILDLPTPRSPLDLFAGKETSLQAISWRMSPPTRFGPKYLDELKKSDSITLCINANVVDIGLDPSLTSVSSFVFRSFGRPEPFKVRARFFALCCGGLENPRILLNANTQLGQGLGNAHDLVGRFFSEHVELEVGQVLMTSADDIKVVDQAADEEARTGLGDYLASDDLLTRLGCLSFVVGLAPFGDERSPHKTYADTALCALPFSERLSVAVLGRAPVCFDERVIAVIQQAGAPDNRVTLAETKDRLGLRQLALTWNLTDLDLTTIRTAAMEMGRALAEHNIGRMKLAAFIESSQMPSRDGLLQQNHHMSTTRMSDSPESGVVDSNCRVHGIENLYIGGSSVFSSAGVSNPTYTIVQLALRLADHLNGQFD
jgi:choline dehydrogenase-like flavoprotein